MLFYLIFKMRIFTLLQCVCCVLHKWTEKRKKKIQLSHSQSISIGWHQTKLFFSWRLRILYLGEMFSCISPEVKSSNNKFQSDLFLLVERKYIKVKNDVFYLHIRIIFMYMKWILWFVITFFSSHLPVLDFFILCHRKFLFYIENGEKKQTQHNTTIHRVMKKPKKGK